MKPTMNDQQSTVNRNQSIRNSQFSISRPTRGSALIITMLVVAAISTAAFGMSRIFLADVRVAGSLEDSLKGYYLTEAGDEEGLLRYRIDRNNEQSLNQIPPASPVTRSFAGGNYKMSTTFLTTGPLSARVLGDHSFDTIGEFNAGNTDFQGPPAGEVPQDETVEVTTPSGSGQIAVRWRWQGGVSPANPECGVEITSVLSGGNFDKVLNTTAGPEAEQPIPETGGRTSLRVKPFCKGLDWLAFGAAQPIGRTLQVVESTGTLGRAKRKLQATVNRRSGSIVGLFDFVLGSEEDIIRP